MKDKELERKGRGSFHEMESTVDGVKLRGLKWYDNRAVTMVSSFVSAHPFSTCSRFDKKLQKTIDVPMPNMVSIYNKNMGGVDLADAMISLYRIHTRSKKWYHKILFHIIDMCLVNSWFLYRRDSDAKQIQTKDQLKLYDFRMSVARNLLRAGNDRVSKNKRGRPSNVVEKNFL